MTQATPEQIALLRAADFPLGPTLLLKNARDAVLAELEELRKRCESLLCDVMDAHAEQLRSELN